MLGNDLDVDVLAAPTAIRVRRLRLNAPFEERHDVVLAAAASLRFRLAFQDVEHGAERRRVFDSRRHRRAPHLLFLRGRHFHTVFHFGGRRMERVRGLAAAVGALGLAVREPPPAVVAEDLRLVVCGERGLGDLRPRRVREVLRFRRPSAGNDRLGLLLGLDLGQQGVEPGVLKRLLLWRPAARLRPKGRRFRSRLYGRPGDRLGDLGGRPVTGRRFRVCARGSRTGGSPVSNRLFGGPPRFRPRREIREFGPCPEGSPEGDNGAVYNREGKHSVMQKTAEPALLLHAVAASAHAGIHASMAFELDHAVAARLARTHASRGLANARSTGS